ncbi:SUMF1/EgtB/PvdO family nonheme iron enzyme [uncultured Bosea sp.]|uniref:SUMF1/EgtB/PvdO family nonheme iron enzyme n=1 Tax=uncultured Bosea sp. TaxID=211457 RepID=UPI0025F1E802|nr:SUMF1/EgtB/PvdO family nonheme iron enzyme [uncultured Bosea sp.]
MAWLRVLIAVVLLPMLAASGLAQQPGEAARVALVIANEAYPGALIGGAAQQGRSVAQALSAGGFDVVSVENADRNALRQAIASFAGKLRRGAQAVVFYSGHAIQERSRNFLLPVQNGAEGAVDLDEIVDPLIVARPASALIFLDAGRDNPWLGKAKGLLPLEAMEGIAVLFPTAPGKALPGGPDRAVDAWLKAIRTPGLEMAQAVKQVRDTVSRETRRSQQIWLSAEPPRGLIVTPVFQPVAVAQGSRAVIPPPQTPGATQDAAYDLAFWESIRNSRNAAEYRAYLDAYPNGRFASLARTREQEYRAGPAAPAPTAVAVATPPAAPQQPAAGAPQRDCVGCPELVAIPAGSFQMGSNDLYEFEKPVHPVSIRGFYLGAREVSFEEWDLCIDQGGCNYRPDDRGLGRGKRPVTDIHWNDANAYLTWLSARTGKAYRLPTESEWEYAARAGTTTTYPWGQTLLKERANCLGCNDQKRGNTVPVGQFPANAFGLYDMAGNAAEWVADCWSESYRNAPRDGSAYTVANCRERVLRGGSFNNDPRYLRSAARFKYEADVRFYTNGFRVARDR